MEKKTSQWKTLLKSELLRWENIGLLMFFVLMMITYAALSPHFLTLRNITNVLLQSSALLFLALGQTLAIISAGLDLSQGAIVSVVSVVSAQVIKDHGLLMGTIAGIGSGLTLGLVNGFLIGKARIQPFIATLGMLYIAGGIAMVYVNGSAVFGIPEPAVDQWFYLGGGYLGPIPIPVALAAICLLSVNYLLRNTRLGRHIYAVGGNENVALLSGVKVDRVKVWIYTLSGLLAAIGGYLLSSRVISGQPTLGAGGLLLQAIGAVVIGGTSLFGGSGGVFRTFLGVMIISFMVNGMNLLAISTFIQEIIVGSLIILSVWVSTYRKR